MIVWKRHAVESHKDNWVMVFQEFSEFSPGSEKGWKGEFLFAILTCAYFSFMGKKQPWKKYHNKTRFSSHGSCIRLSKRFGVPSSPPCNFFYPILKLENLGGDPIWQEPLWFFMKYINSSSTEKKNGISSHPIFLKTKLYKPIFLPFRLYLYKHYGVSHPRSFRR